MWVATDTDDPEPGLIEFLSLREHEAELSALRAERDELKTAIGKALAEADYTYGMESIGHDEVLMLREALADGCAEQGEK